MSKLVSIIYAFTFLSCSSNSNKNSDIDSSLIVFTPIKKFDFDSLKKYSYLVYAEIDSVHQPNGTGFFIRYNGNLYFISAIHVFLGKYGNALHIAQAPNYPDTLKIVIKREGIKARRYKLPIGDLKNKLQYSPFRKPDVYAYKVDEKDFGVPIYSIEKFIDTTYDVHKITKAVTCGYTKQETIARMIFSLPVCTEEDVQGYYWKKLILNGLSNKPEDDTIDYTINKTIESEGYSGSPVYLLYENRMIFGGLMTSANDRDKWTMVLRPENVLKEIKHEESLLSKK